MAKLFMEIQTDQFPESRRSFGRHEEKSAPAHVEFVKDGEVSITAAEKKWLAKHVRQSQYVIKL